MDNLSRLPNDTFYEALDFLSFNEIIRCSVLNKIIFDMLFEQPHLLFKRHLNREFPSYAPFQNLNNPQCVRKLVAFFRRDFNWEILEPCSGVSPRYLHRSAVTADGELIFFGGAGAKQTHFNDTWKVTFRENEDKVVFQKYNSTSTDPTSRDSSSMCLYQGNVFCFGGRDSHGGFLNSLMCFEVETGAWSEVHPSSAAPGIPPHRWGQTVIEWQGFLILFGGGEYGVIFNDLWVLDLKSLLRDTAGRWIITSGWRQVNAHTSDEEAEAGSQPRSRSGHACCVLGDHFMHILGGNNMHQTFDDMWRIDLRAVAESYRRGLAMAVAVGEVAGVLWELIPVEWGAVRPLPQIGHVAVALGSRRLLVFGGRDVHARRMISGTMMYDVKNNTWERLQNVRHEECVQNRTGHCALPTERGLVFFGGLCEDDEHTAEVVCLDLFSPQPRVSSGNAARNTSYSFFSFKSFVDSFSSRLGIREGALRQGRLQVLWGEDLPSATHMPSFAASV